MESGICELFTITFKYNTCLYPVMKQKTLADDKKFQKLLRDIDEANKDPKFRKAIKEFIHITTGHKASS